MDIVKTLPKMGYIKDLRKELGFSQSELAKKTEIPQQTISRMERRINDVGYTKVMRILEFLLNQKEKGKNKV